MKLAVGEDLLQDHDNQNGQQLTADERDILERGLKTLPTFKGNFTHVRGAGAVLSPNGESLE